jgi:hypothetical protein
MSLIFATQTTAVATVILAVGAIVTGVFAFLAFRAQREQLRAIESSVKDQQDLTLQQAELISVQSGQLELQRAQLEDQRRANATHGEVLELQAEEIRESLKQREREAEAQRRSQAARVTAWIARTDAAGSWEARIRNASDLPIFDVRTFFHAIHKNPVRGGWDPVGQGGPPPDETICVFPPQTDRSVAVPEKVQAIFGEVTDRTYVVSVEFTDAAGNSWERDPRGALIPRS